MRVGAGGCGWVRVGAGGCGWVRVGAAGDVSTLLKIVLFKVEAKKKKNFLKKCKCIEIKM